MTTTAPPESIGPEGPRGVPIYRLAEPRLLPAEAGILESVRRDLIGRFGDDELGPPGADALHSAVERLAARRNDLADPDRRARLEYYLAREFLGYGPIDGLLRDPEIEEITLDGVGAPVYIVHRRFGPMATPVRFEREAELDRFVLKLAERAGAHLSRFEPLADGRLPNGARLAATLGREVSPRGSSFAVRRFRDRPYRLPDLVAGRTLSPEMAAYLWIALEDGASTMIVGETGSGKTTTLNALLGLTPESAKLVTIEDTRELQVDHGHWVPLATRASLGPRDAQGRRAGEIDLFDLVRAALRQRPQVLAVGEVRGAETFTLFQAMATGQPCHSTFHAGSVAALVRRLESPPIGLPRALLAALPVVTLQRAEWVGGRRVRRIVSLTEIEGIDPVGGDILASPVFSWNRAQDGWTFRGRSALLERAARARGVGTDTLVREMEHRARFLEALGGLPSLTEAEFRRHLSEYRTDPEAALARVAPGGSRGGAA
ncbi:MAG: type II/IV secretion system ATPase subunit [Thermoplasmata archaeon]